MALQPSPGMAIDLVSLFRKHQLHRQEDQFSTGGPIAQTRPVADPQNQTAATAHSINAASRVVVGRITDATPVGQVYRVQFEKVLAPMPAVYMPRTSASRFGVVEFTSLQPGSLVVCVVHTSLEYAVILGSIPTTNTNPARGMFSLLHTSTKARVDSADFAPYHMENNGGAPSFSAGRPYDAILGDYGAISETGCRVLVDSFMAQLGVTEMSQLTFYHHDMLGKLAAYNLMTWTCCSERESLNDQDEVSDWTGYATYPWEQLGQLTRQDPARLLTAEQWQKGTPEYSKVELQDDFSMPFHREREWHGYLGQGGRRAVVAPPKQGAATSYAGGRTVTSTPPGLFDTATLLNGRHSIQSSKGITIAKRCGLILPVRRRRPEDPNGDTAENYKASGMLGEGATPQITGDIQTPSSDMASQNRAMGLLDVHAYFCGYANNQPFISHTEDYDVAEEQAADWCDGKSAEVPSFAELRDKMLIDAERYKHRVRIDHRYGEEDYHTLPCGIDFLDDGGVVLYDGFGGEIRMTGGSVTISAPGDVWLKSGRNTNIWGGDDVNVRARNSADIIASNKDVRIKSEKNMQLIAGNSGVGGLLLESRSVGTTFNFDKPGEEAVTSGVVIRAPKSVVATWSQDIYLRTGSDDGSIANGVIYLDAAKGAQQVVMIASNITGHVKNYVDFNFGAPGEPTHSTYFSKSLTTAAGSLFVGGSIGINGGVYAKGSYFSTTGHIYTANAALNGNLVGTLEGESLTDTIDYVATAREYIESVFVKSAIELFTQVVDARMYVDGAVGSDTVITKAEGSLRTREDYGNMAFAVFEDRWQQLARLGQQPMLAWKEKPVLVQGAETYPYPGKEAFAGSSSGAGAFYQQDTTLFDVAAGHSKPHGSGDSLAAEYAAPAFGAMQSDSLNTYTVLGSST